MEDAAHSPLQEGPVSEVGNAKRTSASPTQDSLGETSNPDRLASISVHLIRCADVRAVAAAISSEKPVRRQRIYAKVFVNPGNQSATSKVLTIEDGLAQVTWDETIALQAFSLAFIDVLAAAGVCDLVVEVWEIGASERSHEQVGTGHVAMQKVAEKQTIEPFDLVLVRKSGRGFAGKVTLKVTLDFEFSNNVTPFSSSFLSDIKNDKSVSGKGTLLITIIACGGLESSLVPFVTATLGEQIEPQRSDAALWSEQMVTNGELPANFQAPVAVWNHHFRLQVDLSIAQTLKLKLRLMDENSFPAQAELTTAELDLRNWDSLIAVSNTRAIKCVAMQNAAQRGGGGAATVAPQLLLACYWSPGGDDEGVGDPGGNTREAQYAVGGREESAEPQSSNSPRQSISLGSALTLTINGICQISSKIFEKMTASGKTSDIVIRGCLLPNGGTSRVLLSMESFQVNGSCCNGAADICVRFAGDGNSNAAPVLSFELSPIVFDAHRSGSDALRLEVEIRSKRSRDWSLSFCVGLASFVHGGGGQAQDWSSQLRLLDKADNFAGVICTAISVRAADSSLELSSSVSQITRTASSARVKLQILDLKPSSVQANASSQVFIKLWSSSVGRQRSFKSSPTSWDPSGSKTPVDLPTQASPVCKIEMTTESAATEVFFVELCLFSHRERNEVLGSCSFSLSPDFLLGHQSKSASSGIRVDTKWFRLLTSNPTKASNKSSSSGFTGDSEICGKILIAMQIQDPQSAQVTHSLSPSPSSLEVKAASSILSDGKYAPTGGQPENRGMFEIEVIDAYPPPPLSASASNGDSMRVRLQMLSSSQWSEQSSFQEIVGVNARGDRKVSWNESFTSSSVSWFSKDRMVPALNFELTIRCNQQPNSEAIRRKPQQPQSTSSASRSPSRSLQTTRSVDKRNRIPTKSTGDSAGSEWCLGTYTLDLCALFTQPNAATMRLLLLVPVDSFGEDDSKGDERVENEHSVSLKIPLLVSVRLVTAMKAPPSSLEMSPTSQSRPLQVNGEVCLHILTASGSFLRRGDVHADQYFVFAGFGSKSVSTRLTSPTPADAASITWNEHLVLSLQCPATPVIQLQVFKKSCSLNGADELVGSLSLPLFPSITQEQHLVAFTLPFASPASNGLTRGELRKEGTLEFEIQFLDRLHSQKLEFLASRERLELTIHQLKGIRGGNGLLPLLASSASLQVARLSPVGWQSRTSHIGDQLTVYEANIQLLAGSDQTDDVTDLGDDHTVDLTAAVSGIQGHEGVVLALQLCDLERKPRGHAHFPLRKGWRERLFSQKAQRAWYQMHRTDQASEDRSTAQVQLSFTISSVSRGSTGCFEVLAGKFYVQVKESFVPQFGGDHRILKQIQSGASAVILISVARGNASSAQVVKCGRTRKALLREKAGSWLWMNEAFRINQPVENPFNRLLFELVSDSIRSSLVGSIEIERMGIETSEEWVTLTSNTAGAVASDSGICEELEAQLFVQTKFVPAFTGVFELKLGPTRPLTESQTRIPIEKEFMKCTWKRKTFATPMTDALNSKVELGSSKQWTLEIPFDPSYDDDSVGGDSSSRGEIPTLLVQWMGFASSIQEVCLGECTVDLHAFLTTPKMTASGDNSTSSQQLKWYLLHDKHDKSTRTGFVSMSIVFRPQRIRSGGGGGRRGRKSTQSAFSGDQPARWSLTRSQHQVSKSESLVVWKKLFYLLDENGNRRIDLNEFKQLFLHHKDALTSSLDGQNLFQSLFSGVSMGPTASPSEKQLEELFADMDTNHDQEIEWSEYVNFLLRKQHEQESQVYIIDEEDHENGEQDQQLAQLPVRGDQRKRELCTKRKEDLHAQASSSATRSPQVASALNQNPIAAPVRKNRGHSINPPPPFPPIPSSSTSNGKEVLSRKPELPDVVSTRQHSRSSRMIEVRGGTSTMSTSGEVSREQLEVLRAQVNTLKEHMDAKDEENVHLRHELRAAQMIQTLDQQKYANLSSEYQQLQRNFQILQLAKQKEAIQAEAQAVRVHQTLAKHDQLLQDRERQRRHHHEASILLQSRIRSRFEQKRFQALKLQRMNAAITLQCFYRTRKAINELRDLQTADRLVKLRFKAASRLQRFVHQQLQRKVRGMMSLAQQLSVQIIQKHARRFVGVRAWRRQKRSVVVLQCWARQRLAYRFCKRFRNAFFCIKNVVHMWICKWKWRKLKKSARRVQRWWRRVAHRLCVLREQNAAARRVQVHWRRRQSQLREEQHDLMMECIEAAVCVQALWRGHKARKRIEAKRTSREEAMKKLEATVCIQAVWREQRRMQNVVQAGDRSDAIGIVDNGSTVEMDTREDEDIIAALEVRNPSIEGSVGDAAHTEQDGFEEKKGEDPEDDAFVLTGDQTLGDECVLAGSNDVVDEGGHEAESEKPDSTSPGDACSEHEPSVVATSSFQGDRPSNDETVQTVQPAGFGVLMQEQERAPDDHVLESLVIMREVDEALQRAVGQVCGSDPVKERELEKSCATEESSSEPKSPIESTGERENSESEQQSAKADTDGTVDTTPLDPDAGVMDEPGLQPDRPPSANETQEALNKESEMVVNDQEHERALDDEALPVQSVEREVNEALRCVVSEICGIDLVTEREVSQVNSTHEQLGTTNATSSEGHEQLPNMSEEPTIDNTLSHDPAATAGTVCRDVEVSDDSSPTPHSSDVDSSGQASTAQASGDDNLARHVLDAMLQALEAVDGTMITDGGATDSTTTTTCTRDTASSHEVAEPSAVNEVQPSEFDLPLDTMHERQIEESVVAEAPRPMTPRTAPFVYEEPPSSDVQSFEVDKVLQELTYDVHGDSARRQSRDEREPNSSLGSTNEEEHTLKDDAGADEQDQPPIDLTVKSEQESVSTQSHESFSDNHIYSFQETNVEAAATSSSYLSREGEASEMTAATSLELAPQQLEATVAVVRAGSPERKSVSEDGNESEREGEERSDSTSVDSTDLMWEADALSSFKSAYSNAIKDREEEDTRRKKPPVRMDSERILADLSRFDEAESE